MAETYPLRRRMIEDMTVRNLSPAPQRSYVHAVPTFSRFFGRSPDTLTLEDVRTYQVHFASKRRGLGEPQPDGGGAAVLLLRHARDGGDPRHLGAEIGGVAVLHSWGQAMQHHPHVHCIVPGGGLSHDRRRWIACPPGFFLSVKVLGRLFRRLFLERLAAAFASGGLRFFGDLAPRAEPRAFATHCAARRRIDWVV